MLIQMYAKENKPDSQEETMYSLGYISTAYIVHAFEVPIEIKEDQESRLFNRITLSTACDNVQGHYLHLYISNYDFKKLLIPD